jgi:hypothetical protein
MFHLKKVYYFAITAIIVMAGIILLIIYTQGSKKNGDSGFAISSCRTLSAVPVDAVGLWLFNSPGIMAESVLSQKQPYFALFNQQNGLYKLSNRLIYLVKSEQNFKILSQSNLITSLHYSGKNEVSLLLSVDLKSINQDLQANLIERLTNGNIGTYRDFNGAILYNSSEAIVAIHKDFLLVSTSPLLVEASVRHLNSGASILDNKEFSEIVEERVLNGNALFINHTQIGKLFSGLAASKYLKYADFISKFSSWSVMSAKVENDYIVLDGNSYNLKGAGNYGSALQLNNAEESDAQYIVPFNTYALFSVSPKEIDVNVEKIREYREIEKKLNLNLWNRAYEWLNSSSVEEISLAAIPFGGEIEWVTLIRYSRDNFLKRLSDKIFSNSNLIKDTILKNDNRGLINELIGSIFNLNEEEYILNVDNWQISGSRSILEEFKSGRASRFSMADFIAETPAAGETYSQEMPFSIIVNYTGLQDSIAYFFKKGISENVKEALNKRNLGVAQYSILPDKEGLSFRVLFYAKNMEKLPVPPIEESSDGPAGWQRDSIVKVPEGPFELRNFDTGEKEYLVQLKNYRLQLADKDLKGIWAIPFQTPLRGFVEQVDFYNNGKLQMLFASGNMIYLLDRTGRYINPYPRRVNRLVELGPKVYKNKDSFMVMLLHTDNSLSLYDKECKPLEAWKDITVEETIKDFPELMEAGGNLYWILRTQVKTRIYTINGLEITSSLGNHSLLSGTPVKKVSEQEVEVRRTDGAEIRLNLETGDIKKLKKRR